MFKYYIEAIKNYTNFNGKANRKEFWFFVLANLLIHLILIILMGLTIPPESTGSSELTVSKGIFLTLMILYGLYNLFMLIPSLAIFVRRLHDIHKSGWYLLLYFIPIFGPIVLFIFAVLPSVVKTEN